MSRQTLPESTDKYRKYLAKYEGALRSQNRTKAGLYSQKLNMYGMLMQSGGTLSDQLQAIIKQVRESFDRFGGSASTEEIVKKINQLKTQFDAILARYGADMRQSLAFGQEVKRRLDNTEVGAIGDIDELNKLLAQTGEKGVDEIITREDIKGLANNIASHRPTQSEYFDNLQQLSDFYDNPHGQGSDAFRILGEPNSGIVNAEPIKRELDFMNAVRVIRDMDPTDDTARAVIDVLNKFKDSAHIAYVNKILSESRSSRAQSWAKRLAEVSAQFAYVPAVGRVSGLGEAQLVAPEEKEAEAKRRKEEEATAKRRREEVESRLAEIRETAPVLAETPEPAGATPVATQTPSGAPPGEL